MASKMKTADRYGSGGGIVSTSAIIIQQFFKWKRTFVGLFWNDLWKEQRSQQLAGRWAKLLPWRRHVLSTVLLCESCHVMRWKGTFGKRQKETRRLKGRHPDWEHRAADVRTHSTRGSNRRCEDTRYMHYAQGPTLFDTHIYMSKNRKSPVVQQQLLPQQINTKAFANFPKSVLNLYTASQFMWLHISNFYYLKICKVD